MVDKKEEIVEISEEKEKPLVEAFATAASFACELATLYREPEGLFENIADIAYDVFAKGYVERGDVEAVVGELKRAFETAKSIEYTIDDGEFFEKRIVPKVERIERLLAALEGNVEKESIDWESAGEKVGKVIEWCGDLVYWSTRDGVEVDKHVSLGPRELLAEWRENESRDGFYLCRLYKARRGFVLEKEWVRRPPNAWEEEQVWLLAP